MFAETANEILKRISTRSKCNVLLMSQCKLVLEGTIAYLKNWIWKSAAKDKNLLIFYYILKPLTTTTVSVFFLQGLVANWDSLLPLLRSQF